MPRVAEYINSAIDKMTHGTEYKVVKLLHTEYANLTPKDLNTSIDKPENRWNIHYGFYDMLTFRVKPLCNGQLCYCSWSFGILMSPIGIRIKQFWCGKLR
jgi:hypothetical protein